MDSLNAAVPGRARRLVEEVAADLAARGATPEAGDWRVREDPSLLVKRLPDTPPCDLRARAREALSGLGPFEVRADAVGQFPEAVAGPSPVVYLAVDSPGLARAHDRLCEAFGAVADLEGAAYTPHVTVARGGDPAAANAVVGPVEPVTWTVETLSFRDGCGPTAGRLALPP